MVRMHSNTTIKTMLQTGLWVSGVLLLLGLILPYTTAADQESERDLFTITELASGYMTPEASLMVHHGTVWQTYENEIEFELLFEQLIGQLFQQATAGLEGYVFSTVHGRPAAEWTLQLDQAVQTVRMVGMSDGRSTYVTVRWEGTLQAAAEAGEWQREISSNLSDLGIEQAWRTQVQGWVGNDADPDAVLQSVLRGLKAIELDRYEDANSLSVSLNSKLLHQSVNSGGNEMHLQAALHRDTEVENWRITLAAPVILADY